MFCKICPSKWESSSNKAEDEKNLEMVPQRSLYYQSTSIVQISNIAMDVHCLIPIKWVISIYSTLAKQKVDLRSLPVADSGIRIRMD